MMTWRDKSETLILCEGYHDRAFWKGLLPVIGCKDPVQGAGTVRPQVIDPWNDQVKGGDYAFASQTDSFIRVRPCQGVQNVLPTLKLRLRQTAVKPLARLVVNIDSDTHADGTPAQGSPVSRQQLESAIRDCDQAFQADGQGGYLALNGSVRIQAILWGCDDPPSSTLPNKQTLERLVCASVNAAYSNRATPIDRWLQSRPDAPLAGPKEHALSHVAGWYAELGVDAFYATVSKDPMIWQQIITRLKASSAWQIAQAIAA